MTDARTKKASDKAHALDDASEALRTSARKKWDKALIAASIAFFILATIGVIGIMFQNYYSLRNTHHIDCIIKDLATPPPAGASPNAKKYIDYRSILTNDCNIKFTQ